MQEDYGRTYAHLYRNHWWWRAREGILLRALRRLPLPGSAEILDIGCGDGLFFPELVRFGTVWGLEVDASLIAPDSPYRAQISQAPLGDPAYAGRRFDLITALDVIEHIEDDRAAVQAMVEMLRPGGFLVITVPAFMCLWDHHDEINRHYRRYTARGLRELLAREGRTVTLRYLFPSLFFAKLAFCSINRFRARPRAQHHVPPAPVNRLLTAWCDCEDRLVSAFRVPFGSSLLAVVRTEESRTPRISSPSASPDNSAR